LHSYQSGFGARIAGVLALSQAVAIGGCDRQAVGAQGITMAIRPTPTETKRRRGHPMLWLFMGLFIFALFAGFALALDWIDPQNSRLF
jgi:hypothetical protein